MIPADCTEYSDHRPDLTLLLKGLLTVFDLKVFAPIGPHAASTPLVPCYYSLRQQDAMLLQGLAGSGTLPLLFADVLAKGRNGNGRHVRE